MKENVFINIIKEELTMSASYIGDDTAFIPDRDLILTQDTLIEDVHFRRSTISAYDLGRKAIAVNLSDIAASGGIPEFILVSLSLPADIEENFIRSLYKGINDICLNYGVLTVGGDITGASKINLSITAIGKSQNIIPAKRSNAKVDDLIVVTGEFGSSRAGLWILELLNTNTLLKIDTQMKNKFIQKHINPIPKLEVGRKIAELMQPSPTIMDTSDGLADALYKISYMSKVSMDINLEQIPYDKDLNKISSLARVNPLKWIFYGGEDYELVATVSKNVYKKLLNVGMDIKMIGKIIPSNGESYIIVNKDKKNGFEITQKSLNDDSFNHFS